MVLLKSAQVFDKLRLTGMWEAGVILNAAQSEAEGAVEG